MEPEPAVDPTSGAPPGLVAWVRRSVGEHDLILTRLSAGNRRQMWVARPRGGETSRGWVVRVDSSPDPEAYYSLAREARIYTALNGIGASVPVLRATRPDGTAVVMDLLPGVANIRELDAAGRRRALESFLAALGHVHSAPLDTMDLTDSLGYDPLTDGVRECVHAELDRWERAMRAVEVSPDPLLELGLRWLRQNVPASSDKPVLVHGDAGPGNFLFVAGSVTGIVDWEFAHPGEPLEDLAWVTLRSALDGVPEVDQLLLEHCRRNGIAAEPARLRYYQALVLWRVMVIRHAAIGDPDRNLGRNLYYRLMHRRMFIDAMLSLLDVERPVVRAPESRSTPRSWLYDACIHHIKSAAIPAVADETAREHVAGLVRVLRYLRVWDSVGREIRCAAREALARHPSLVEPDSDAAPGLDDEQLVGAIRTGAISLREATAILAVGVLTEHEACRHLLGADADSRLAGFAAG